MSHPIQPPFALDDVDLPPLQLCEGDAAFVVDEVPAYSPCGEGTHVWVRVRKSGLTTRDAVFALATAAGVDPRDVGVAGQKDRHAITSQWMSIPERSRPPAEWELRSGVEVVEVSRHGNKLRVGHVAANDFALRFATLSAEAAVGPVRAALERLAAGMPNYFGVQRFGIGGGNLSRALRWLESGRPLGGRDARFKQGLYASVVQSEVFNRYLTHRRADPRPLVAGEVVRLSGSRSVFEVSEPAAELPRLESGDIVRTGPMIGPKMRAPSGEPAGWEAAAAASLPLSEAQRDSLARHAPGTRRDLSVRLENFGAEVDGADCVVVRFRLPAGSYATQVIRDLTRLPWDAPLRPLLDE
ncbi:MAG: tRNA pseudouridine(13) synthase TruD [Myxococcales bacterium]|nr:tRNA pseudouridine(13) synthase TruD [Myxococcales bacterium]